MSAIAGISIFLLACAVLAAIGLSTAEEGYEDETGYHKGKQ